MINTNQQKFNACIYALHCLEQKAKEEPTQKFIHEAYFPGSVKVELLGLNKYRETKNKREYMDCAFMLQEAVRRGMASQARIRGARESEDKIGYLLTDSGRALARSLENIIPQLVQEDKQNGYWGYTDMKNLGF
ncbi:hypothetical protein FJZ18_01755 [Candidatus Pacearchaeota archaeon]|nr:hypothetical protein [Candidatus Pacearchaeota archaeon]